MQCTGTNVNASDSKSTSSRNTRTLAKTTEVFRNRIILDNVQSGDIKANILAYSWQVEKQGGDVGIQCSCIWKECDKSLYQSDSVISV